MKKLLLVAIALMGLAAGAEAAETGTQVFVRVSSQTQCSVISISSQTPTNLLATIGGAIYTGIVVQNYDSGKSVFIGPSASVSTITTSAHAGNGGLWLSPGSPGGLGSLIIPNGTLAYGLNDSATAPALALVCGSR